MASSNDMDPQSNLWLVAEPSMRDHDPGPFHPESPVRLDRVLERLHRRSWAQASWHQPTAVSRDAVLGVHTFDYADRVDRSRGLQGALDHDVPISPRSVDVAYLAAGAGVMAVEGVMSGRTHRAFALVRPPGHHAESTLGMGFCIFNNIAIAAAHARTHLGANRVLIIDWDVHHGNGTAHLFADRSDILVINTHQAPHYPGTGRASDSGTGAGAGYTVNIPLPAGMGDGDYAMVFSDIITPIADAYAPDLVLVSAGFDPHVDDPLGSMEVTASGFANLCGQVLDIAERHAQGRLCMLLEGGYDLAGLADSVESCTEVLSGAQAPAAKHASATGRQLCQTIREAQRAYWPV